MAIELILFDRFIGQFVRLDSQRWGSLERRRIGFAIVCRS